MSEELKHSPINIPIVSGDDEPEDGRSDVIEIDADDLSYDADEVLAEVEAEAGPVRESADAAVTEAEAIDPYLPPGGHDSFDPYVEPEGLEPVELDEDEPDDGDADALAVDDETTTVSKQAVIELMSELREKTDSIARLSDERTDLYDKLLRKQAEFENFRKRGEREMQEAYVRARADLLSDLLPVLDNFDLAVQHADTSNPDAVREGVHLIHKQLFDSLFRLGLEPIEADGQPFDPELHDAVATEPNDEVPDHTVVAVLQRGYRLGDRLLRPARVKVAVTP